MKPVWKCGWPVQAYNEPHLPCTVSTLGRLPAAELKKGSWLASKDAPGCGEIHKQDVKQLVWLFVDLMHRYANLEEGGGVVNIPLRNHCRLDHKKTTSRETQIRSSEFERILGICHLNEPVTHPALQFRPSCWGLSSSLLLIDKILHDSMYTRVS